MRDFVPPTEVEIAMALNACRENPAVVDVFRRLAMQRDALEAENAALRAALNHQLTALIIVRDRQHGRASADDINIGIEQINEALKK